MLSLSTIILLSSSCFFGILASLSSYKEEKIKNLLKEKEKQYQHKIYEIAILKEIQDRIGYSLDTEKVIDVITSSLESLFPYSAASSLIIKNGKLIFKTTVKKPVNTNFVTQVKDNMLNSLTALLNEPLPKTLEETINGIALEEENKSILSSFFNIPLVINNKIVGLINISSTHPNLNKEEEITILYKMTDLANHTLSRLQDVLTKEKGKLTSLIASLEDGVFMVDMESQITVINKTAKEILRITKDRPTIIDVLSSLPNSYNFGDKIDKSIHLNKKIEEKEVHFGEKTLNIIITPVLNSLTQEPKVIGASFLIHDTTLEKALSKMKEDFTNIIVHDLRSPLTSIKASTEMLSNEKNLTDNEKKHLIAIINNQTLKMLDEISLILDATKLDVGLFTIQKTPGDITKVIENAVESFRVIAQNKFINLTTQIDPLIPQAPFDGYNIRRVIDNLLSNSLKFTSRGGTINVRCWHTAEEIAISINDSGTGIPKEKQHLLFSKFSQIRSANGTVGTGLGLYIVKGIIQAHNGTISLESEPNKGTTVTFTIPINNSAQSSQPFSIISKKATNPLIN